MARHYDAIVLGLGAMGSATLYQLAKRGAHVLGIDRHSPPHAFGSSHGDTRITRLAIGEGEEYTPLAIRSHEIWREVERETGAALLTTCGGLVISSPGPRATCHGSDFFANTLAAARAYGIRHEVLEAAEIRRRFPAFCVRDDEIGYFEHEAGFLRPEACVSAQLQLAGHHGAEIHRGEQALLFSEERGLVHLQTAHETYAARRLVVSAGPWLPGLLGDTWAGRFTVLRQVLCWFDVKGDINAFRPGRFPVFIWELAGHAQPLYGFPALDGPHGGVKIASEQYEAATTPETVQREVRPEEARALYESQVAPHFAGVSGNCVKALACLYTMTADYRFVIEAHPQMPAVLIVSPCSGHGFKHSAAIGEQLARRVMDDGADRA